jgi:hypothetical protein
MNITTPRGHRFLQLTKAVFKTRNRKLKLWGMVFVFFQSAQSTSGNHRNYKDHEPADFPQKMIPGIQQDHNSLTKTFRLY